MGKAIHLSFKESLIIIFLSASLLLISSVFTLVSAQVSATNDKADLDVSYTVRNASDSKSDNGSISLTVKGGVTPYYIYCIQTKKEGTVQSNLKPGVYLFTVLDSGEHKKVVRVEVGINKK